MNSTLLLYQAEHHARALSHLKGVHFFRDEKRGRVGMLTTLEVKHAMCTLLNAMLRYCVQCSCAYAVCKNSAWECMWERREDRVCCTSGEDFVTCNLKEPDVKRILRDELEMYSYQFKQAATIFGKQQVALSGKVCVCCVLVCLVTKEIACDKSAFA